MSPTWRDRRGRFGMTVLLVAVAVALAAPLVTNGHPDLQAAVIQTRFLPPLATDLHGAWHVLGTDRFGRDVWTRLAYGARISLGVGVLAVAISVALGCLVGGVAGASQGWLSRGLMAGTDFAQITFGRGVEHDVALRLPDVRAFLAGPALDQLGAHAR